MLSFLLKLFAILSIELFLAFAVSFSIYAASSSSVGFLSRLAPTLASSPPALKLDPIIPPAITPPIVSSLVVYLPKASRLCLSSAFPVDHCSCIASPPS